MGQNQVNTIKNSDKLEFVIFCRYLRFEGNERV